MRPSHTRTTAGAATAALVAAFIVSTAPAVADPDDSPMDCDATATAEHAAAASAECGTDIEILDERTPWATTYATPEGTFRTDTSITAERTDINGEWQAIDTTLLATGDGIIATAPVFDLTFSDGTPGQPLATISDGDRTLSMQAPLPLTTPVLDGDTITYPGVLDDVDLVLQVHSDGTGFSEVLRVHTPEAAANPTLAELNFPLEVEGELTLVEQGEGFAAQDSAGQDIFVSPTPLMWDSASATTTPVTMSGAHSSSSSDEPEQSILQPADGDTIVAMPATLSEEQLTIEPDQDMLTAPDTVWPVYIDPTITGSQTARTIVRSGFPTDTSFYNWTGDQGLGYCATSGGCTRNGVYRMIFKFGGLSTIGSLSSADVISATFSVWGEHTWACTATGVQLWRTGTITSSTTWNTQPSWSSQLQSRNLVHKSTCSSKPRWIEWNATAAAKYTATNSLTTMNLGLRTTNESSMAASWQRYRHDAKLSVTYSRLPSAGTSQATTPASTCSTSNPAYFRTTTPQFRWKVTDPDGGNVTGNLDIYRVTSGSTLVWNPTVPTQASGSQFSLTVPSGTLANGHTYEWQTGGIDVPTGRAGPVKKCRFIIDTTAPGTTTVATVSASMPATYPRDRISGGVGLQGRFQLTNPASDVASFKYSFNSDALNQSVTASSSGATVNFTPTTAGSQRFLVQAVDKAGNVGPTTTYRFSVNFPSVTARWNLDDSAGTTGLDNVGSNNLTISSSTTWSNGMLADVAGDPTDTALHFDSTSDTATSAGPAVNTGISYTVMAQVKLDTLSTTPQTAVSQTGQTTAAFQLGQLPAANCGTLGQACWFLQIRSTDAPSASYTRVTSAIPATTGEWVHLTGIVDTTNDTLSLYVCHPADTTEPILAGPTPLASPITWAAGGRVELGRAANSGATGYTNRWNGAIDDVRLYNNIIDLNTIRSTCWGG